MASRTTINLLVNYSVEPKKQGSSGGAWDWGGREPVEAGEEPAGAVELGDADEEGEQAGWGEAGGCDGENPIEAFDRAQGDDLGGGRGKSSARPGKTSTLVNVRARTTSRRKATFFCRDSTSVTRAGGKQILMGKPGKPAPEPMSRRQTEESWQLAASLSVGPWPPGGSGAGATLEVASSILAAGNRRWARNRDSPKWRVTTSSGPRTAVRLMRRFQWSNRSMYVDICSS